MINHWLWLIYSAHLGDEQDGEEEVSHGELDMDGRHRDRSTGLHTSSSSAIIRPLSSPSSNSSSSEASLIARPDDCRRWCGDIFHFDSGENILRSKCLILVCAGVLCTMTLLRLFLFSSSAMARSEVNVFSLLNFLWMYFWRRLYSVTSSGSSRSNSTFILTPWGKLDNGDAAGIWFGQ